MRIGSRSSHLPKIFSAIFALAGIFLVSGTCSAQATNITVTVATSTPGIFATSTVPSDYSRIFYYRDSKKAQASLFAHPKSIGILAPQAYSVDSSGKLKGDISLAIRNFAEKNGIRIMPLVTNKGFSRKAADSVLSDAAKQDAAINVLVAEAKTKNYSGWQFDFEGMNASSTDRYSAFIARAGDAMKKNNLVFSVAVVAQISANPADYPRDLWNKVVGAYDYPALASSTDFVSVMSYDDPTSKGPVAGFSWLKQVIDYSLKTIPASKLSLGIPLYYWKWNDKTGKLVDIGGYAGIQNVLKRKGSVADYSSAEQAPFIKYKVKKVPYTLWYENSQSVAQKIGLISQNGLLGFSAWTLGLEVPSVYSAFETSRIAGQ